MAKLYFYYAAMNAGKSTTLLQADFNYRERGMAAATGPHFQTFHGRLIRMPMRNSTLPSAPVSAENLPVLMVATVDLRVAFRIM